MSLLVRSEILHFLINTLSATGKYSRYDGKNFKQPVQMELFNTCYLTHYLGNTWIADGKYSRYYRENFKRPIQMELSKKPKVFVQISLQLHIIFETFWKKSEPYNLSICGIIDSERCGYLYV